MEAPGLVPGRHTDDSVFSYEIRPWDTLGGTHTQATGSICAGVGGLAGNIADTQVVPQHQPGPRALWSEPSSSGHPQAQPLAQVVQPPRAQGALRGGGDDAINTRELPGGQREGPRLGN